MRLLWALRLFLINIPQPFASHLIIELSAIMTKVAEIMCFISLLGFFFCHKNHETIELFPSELQSEMNFDWLALAKFKEAFLLVILTKTCFSIHETLTSEMFSLFSLRGFFSLLEPVHSCHKIVGKVMIIRSVNSCVGNFSHKKAGVC